MDSLHHRFLLPGLELAAGGEQQVQPTGAPGLLDHADRLVQDRGGLVEVALAQVGQGEVAKDDRARLLPVVQRASGALQDR